MMTFVLLSVVLLLAFWNGANDNFKGVATLYGSGTVSYKTAITLATLGTFAGSMTAIFIAQGLISSFSGKGLVPDDVAAGLNFLTAVGFGAAGTILIATRLGFPVSTTHSLVGGLLGAGMMSVGAGVNFSQLGNAFVIPLLVSPFIAFALAMAIYWMFTSLRQSLGLNKESCLCIGARREIIPMGALQNPAGYQLSRAQHTYINEHPLIISDMRECEMLYPNKIAGIYLQKIIDVAHIGSATMVSFARGVNDTPKIAGLLVASQLLDMRINILAIALAMAVGGLLGASRVAETISNKITDINHGQGFSANLATSFLVIVASNFGVPVSTTHVSVGSIFGIGMIGGKQDKRMVKNIIFSWVVTLPVATMLSLLIFIVL
jgi:inorganic phosphate transporter, PiT family